MFILRDRERETEGTSGGGAEREREREREIERERISSRPLVFSAEPWTGLDPTNYKIVT